MAIQQSGGSKESTTVRETNEVHSPKYYSDPTGFRIEDFGRYTSDVLSPEGAAFIEAVKTRLGESKTEAGVAIQFRKLAAPQNSYFAFREDVKVGVLIFTEESLPEDVNDINNYTHLKEAVASVTREFKGVSIINSYTASKNDYKEPLVFASILFKGLWSISDNNLSNFTLANLGKNKKICLNVDTSLSNAKAFFRNYSVGVPPMEYAITVSLSESGDYIGEAPKQIQPLFSVCGYTDFIIDTSASPYGFDPTGRMQPITRYIPVIHISGIASIVDNKALIPLAITLASNSFVNGKLYLNPEAIKDIGWLWDSTVPGKSHFEAESIQELQAAAYTRLTVPTVVVDLIEMKPKLTGLSDILDPTKETGKELFNHFFGININVPLFVEGFRSYVGTFSHKGEEKDSREARYIWLCKELGDRPENDMFLHKRHEKEHLNMLKTLIDVHPKYVCRSLYINPESIAQYISVLNSSGIRVLDGTKQDLGMYDMSGAVNRFGFNPSTSYYNGGHGGFFSY